MTVHLPPFPVDDSTLDLLDRAMTIQPGCDSTSVGDTLRMLSELGGSDTDAVEEELEDGIRLMRDPQYHEHNVIQALIIEVRRLRADDVRADERKRMADQLRDGLEHLDRDGTYGTLVSPGDVAQLIAAVEAGQ